MERISLKLKNKRNKLLMDSIVVSMMLYLCTYISLENLIYADLNTINYTINILVLSLVLSSLFLVTWFTSTMLVSYRIIMEEIYNHDNKNSLYLSAIREIDSIYKTKFVRDTVCNQTARILRIRVISN